MEGVDHWQLGASHMTVMLHRDADVANSVRDIFILYTRHRKTRGHPHLGMSAVWDFKSTKAKNRNQTFHAAYGNSVTVEVS